MRSIRLSAKSAGQDDANGKGVSLAVGGTLADLPYESLGEEVPAAASLDLYSAGVILWELFTNRVPWAGLSFAQLVCQVGIHHKSLPTGLASIPPAIQGLLKELFRVDPTARPTAREVLGRLREIDPAAMLYLDELHTGRHQEAAEKAIESTFV